MKRYEVWPPCPEERDKGVRLFSSIQNAEGSDTTDDE